MKTSAVRNLVLVLGDQLDDQGPALAGFDRKHDRMWMAEASEESTHVWSHQARIAPLLSAMRHFADRLRKRGYVVDYTKLSPHTDDTSTLAAQLETWNGLNCPTRWECLSMPMAAGWRPNLMWPPGSTWIG
jgi:deoxyribodipyrimidine photolyase-related protein